MYTVMTVCTGNICRSPMAEIILRTEFERRGLADKVNVESSGVSDEEYGNPIDRALLRQLPQAKRENVHMYRSFDPNLAKPVAGYESEIDLVDPWYGGAREFEVAIDQIEEVAPFIVDWVERQL